MSGSEAEFRVTIMEYRKMYSDDIRYRVTIIGK